MENEQYLYFMVHKKRLECMTNKIKITPDTNVYGIRIKNLHSYWYDSELDFNTEIYAESKYHVLLRTVFKWDNDVIEKLTMHSDRFCEIHYGSDSFVNCYFYTDKNLRHAFKTFGFKINYDTKNNKITKENKDMPPYKHHICFGGPEIDFRFRDGFQVPCKIVQEVEHITVKDIKFNGPATIIFYEDGSKEVVKCQKNDKNDKEKAIYMAMLKHENKRLFSIINKALSSEDPEKTLAYELLKREGNNAKLLHQLCNNFIKAEKPKKKNKKNKKNNASKTEET